MGLPVIVERNSWTMVQERFNTGWIRDEGLGVVLRSFGEIDRGVAPMLDAQQLAGFRTNVSALNNRAVFEIPDIIDSLLTSGPGGLN
jgi:1,2-diacylglycerol 3-beta-galactosyltransferase